MYQIKRSDFGQYTPRRPKRGKPKYPFHDCGWGDSFFVPIYDATTEAVRGAAISYAGRHAGFRFSCITQKDYEGQGRGTLVTRVESF